MKVFDRNNKELSVGDRVRWATYPPKYRIRHIVGRFVYARMEDTSRLSTVATGTRSGLFRRTYRCPDLERLPDREGPDASSTRKGGMR